MEHDKRQWELMILDGAAKKAIPGDFDGDGKIEIVSDEKWMRLSSQQKGDIRGGLRVENVGACAGDVDNDGRDEVIGAVRESQDGKELFTLYWQKPGKDLSQPWEAHALTPKHLGHPHDICVADVDGDGKNEIVGVHMYLGAQTSIFILRPGADRTQPWQEHIVAVGAEADGTVVADFNGDGIAEIISGPYMYVAPSKNPFAGPWKRIEIASEFREMCKAAMIDITGNGRPDVIIAESEYPDCRVSWFENRMVEDPAHPWIEHPLDRGFNFVHSLDAWRDHLGSTHFFTAEMNQGGWNSAYNHEARIMEYATKDKGKSWSGTCIFKGFGTFQALARDVDGDGQMEIVGTPGIEGSGAHVWKKRETPSFTLTYRHRFLDRFKPWITTDLTAVDVDGDGRQDVVCGAFWYRNPTWERRQIPDIYQIINAYDIDGDGKLELIGTKANEKGSDGYQKLCSELYWLKPVDALAGKWESWYIGTASGGDGGHVWPHGTCIAPVLPNGRLALIARGGGPIELYEVGDDPKKPWEKREMSEAGDAETRMIPVDLTGNGLLDLVAMWCWLENLGNGTFLRHHICDRYDHKAQGPEGAWRGGEYAVADVNGDGILDLVACEEHTNWAAQPQAVSFARLAWFENPGDAKKDAWKMHVIDSIRSPHSLAVADIDNDGEPEIICGEHDPFKPFRSKSKIYIYKKADSKGTAWTRHVVEDRFDNHVGTRLIELEPGRFGIVSQGWQETNYVHLFEPQKG